MIHCLGLPLLLAATPALSGLIDLGESFHVIVLVLAVPTSAFALISGWRRHHAPTPLLCGLTGLALMASAIALTNDEWTETIITVAGSILLASAHIANWSKRRCAEKRTACVPAHVTRSAPQCGTDRGASA